MSGNRRNGATTRVGVRNVGYRLLSRNLLYTGLTRARKLAILLGPKWAIARAVNQEQDQQRYTYLARRLVRAIALGE